MTALNSFAPPAVIHVGDKAKDFKLKNVDGKMVSMADYKNAKGFIVSLRATIARLQAYEGRIMDP